MFFFASPQFCCFIWSIIPSFATRNQSWLFKAYLSLGIYLGVFIALRCLKDMMKYLVPRRSLLTLNTMSQLIFLTYSSEQTTLFMPPKHHLHPWDSRNKKIWNINQINKIQTEAKFSLSEDNLRNSAKIF